MSVGTGRLNIIILCWKYQFHCWEYINGNQTFILDSQRPFICSVRGVEGGYMIVQLYSKMPLNILARRLYRRFLKCL